VGSAGELLLPANDEHFQQTLKRVVRMKSAYSVSILDVDGKQVCVLSGPGVAVTYSVSWVETMELLAQLLNAGYEAGMRAKESEAM
jgi:hypothetical protein